MKSPSRHTIWVFLAIILIFNFYLATENIAEVSVTDDAPKDERTSSLAHTRIEIFYNIYIGIKHPDNAIRIVKEQLGQVSSSMLAKHVKNMTVNFFQIGVLDEGIFNKTFMDDLCSDLNLNCISLGSTGNGYEDATLSKLLGFCKSHKDYQVIYLHDKGSFHPSSQNDRWRRHLTSAATSMDCIQALQTKTNSSVAPSCNVCGLSYTHPFFTGNMFAAECSYVANLLHPLRFKSNQKKIHVELRDMNFTRGEYTFTDKQAWYTGMRRYSCEHWVGTHPDIMPCDLQGDHEWFDWHKIDFENASHTSPRAPQPNSKNSNETAGGNLTFSRLTADLYRYYQYYQKVPSLKSWMFDYFSDGPFWRTALSKYDSSILKSDQFFHFVTNASARNF